MNFELNHAAIPHSAVDFILDLSQGGGSGHGLTQYKP